MNIMKSRSLIVIVLTVLCGAALWGVVAQGRQLSALREEHKHLAIANQSAEPTATETVPIPTPTREVPRELLQLRAEVARLSQQKRELEGARAENERLRLQLENRRTNHATRGFTGPGYVRKSEVKWLGYNSPEDTVQSLFWAAQNRDWDKFLEAFTPETAQKFREAIQQTSDSPDKFFKSDDIPPGFRISGRQQNDDGTISLELQVAPDIQGQRLVFRQIGGQWKFASPH